MQAEPVVPCVPRSLLFPSKKSPSRLRGRPLRNTEESSFPVGQTQSEAGFSIPRANRGS